ncbi:unnamed protein product [Closterium sp. NIES-64]|nr:unnamed protein product [Closterium sp. NIES-64]
MTQDIPSQRLRAVDIYGNSWVFRHVYRGSPKRHLLTTGWSAFVSTRGLVAGDRVLFVRLTYSFSPRPSPPVPDFLMLFPPRPTPNFFPPRGQDSYLKVSIRRKTVPPVATPLAYGMFASGTGGSSMGPGGMDVEGTVRMATMGYERRCPFTVVYHPRLPGSSPFLIPLSTFCLSLLRKQHLRSGLRGIVAGVGSTSSVWPQSQWRSVKVSWSDSDPSLCKPASISPWDISPPREAIAHPPFLPRNALKQLLLPKLWLGPLVFREGCLIARTVYLGLFSDFPALHAHIAAMFGPALKAGREARARAHSTEAKGSIGEDGGAAAAAAAGAGTMGTTGGTGGASESDDGGDVLAGWRLVYEDSDGDTLLVGDGTWT